ncbi:hypothetical protein AAFF_G00230180 [Aldrovandia affinis]|uniref:Uncharacterized protein n=1 Tax=Aldrovandia affinis TaxID=143900 RepID=A0AAD7WUE0_9TELE|nr:hypothetical protein AAFF_G00230180 [Aldrovandia affinis]
MKGAGAGTKSRDLLTPRGPCRSCCQPASDQTLHHPSVVCGESRSPGALPPRRSYQGSSERAGTPVPLGLAVVNTSGPVADWGRRTAVSLTRAGTPPAHRGALRGKRPRHGPVLPCSGASANCTIAISRSSTARAGSAEIIRAAMVGNGRPER